MNLSTSNATALIRARGLTKTFGERTAVDAINFDVRDGEFFGFLGPNGAGKTTTMRMIAGVSPRTAGTLSILGSDPDTDGPRIRGQIGVVHQQETLDQELTVRENLLVFGRFFGIAHKEIAERADQLLELFQLSDRAKDQVEPLSGGMKRRLSIARSLINAPRVLMLDEPTTGLDPQARHLLWDALQRLKRAGTTIVLTTHYMDEADVLGDRIGIMAKGKMMCLGTSLFLKKRFGAGYKITMVKATKQPNKVIEPFLRANLGEVNLLSEVSSEITFQVSGEVAKRFTGFF